MVSIPNVINALPMTASESQDELAKRLRALRERAGWSQETVSQRSGVPQGVISRMERGPNKRPVESTLRRLAEAFAVPMESLLGTAPIPGHVPPALSDGDALERALFRALNPDLHRPSAFDAARRAAREASGSLPQGDPAKLARALLDAAEAITVAGQQPTTVAILARLVGVPLGYGKSGD
jgi:transcriptional regulator with XRE-family HTH domain